MVTSMTSIYLYSTYIFTAASRSVLASDNPNQKLRFNRRLKGKFYPDGKDKNDATIMDKKPKFETLEEMDPMEAYEKLNSNIRNNLKDENDVQFLKTAKPKKQRTLFNWGNDGNGYTDPYETPLADPSFYYDNWSQAYRMLGVYIDCDRPKGQNDSGSGSGDREYTGCARWLVWASYIDPYYSGGGYYEYHGYGDDDDGDDANDDGRRRRKLEDEGDSSGNVGNLNCHEKDTHWELLGIYRQEFYQYIEQISKHLWAIDEYEYVTTLAALAYMTDEDCFQVGYSDSGEYIYAGIQPYSGGDFQMRLYLEEECLYPKDSELGKTYDDFVEGTDVDEDLFVSDDDYSSSNVYTWWTEAQEYTLTNVNNVFDTYRKCVLCMDYPTYQDGYLIGDTGTDEDDLINQCWKFHSHDSFFCDSNCLELAHEQESIKFVHYNNIVYGGQSSNRAYSNPEAAEGSQKSSSLKADIFLTISSILFVACFLSYNVARNSQRRKKKRRSSTVEKDGSRSKSKSRSLSKVRSLRSGSKSFDKSSKKEMKKERSRRLLKSRSAHRDEVARSRSNPSRDLPRRSRSMKESSYQPPSVEKKKLRSKSHGVREDRKDRRSLSRRGRD